MLRRTTRPDLIVPVRDRRKHVRIVTLKNFGRALLVAIVAFAAVSAISHLRAPRADDYGRLYKGQFGSPAVASRAPMVVNEAPVPDATSADPLLISSAVRSQYLGTTTIAPAQVSSSAAVMSTEAPVAFSPSSGGERGGHIAIVGDSSGVTIVKTEKDSRPKLSGGIFK